LVSDPATTAKFNNDYHNCVIRYGDMKKQLAEDMVRFMEPIRDKAKAIEHDKALLSKVIRHGRDKARASASDTIQLVRKAVGVNY